MSMITYTYNCWLTRTETLETSTIVPQEKSTSGKQIWVLGTQEWDCILHILTFVIVQPYNTFSKNKI